MLEQQLAELNIERDNLSRDRQILVHRTQEADRIIESLHMEKRDMLMKHTEETSSLRKRIQVMTDRLDASPAPAMSANPSSSGFSEFNAEFDTLNIGPHDWDNLLFTSDTNNLVPEDFAFGQQSMGPIKPSMLGKKASNATIVPSPAKKANENSNEQPIASSLLFMLLLCGAFVASKPSSSSTSELPKMPPDVRAAAPTILSNLLADTNPSAHQQQLRAALQSFPEPVASDVPQVNNRGVNKLDQLHHHMISPSKQQSDEAAFAMTQAQYASLMDIGPTDADRMNGQIHPARRNLAEVLANTQTVDPSNKADVYTRSLLFEQIPADVVKQFKEMVRDRSQRDHQQQHQQQQQQQQNQQQHQQQQHHQQLQHQPYYKVEA